jgi:hypothetical protein
VIRFSTNQDLTILERVVHNMLQRQGIIPEDYPEELYVFGVANTRGSDVYFSPDLEGRDYLAEVTEDEWGIPVSTRRVGDPPTPHWVALRRAFRRNQQVAAARIIILAWLSINQAINW